MNKKVILCLAVASTFTLATSACADKDKPAPPQTQPPVIVPDDECPRADGQPCK